MGVAEERYGVEEEIDSDDWLDDMDDMQDDPQASKAKMSQPSLLQRIRRFFFKTTEEKRAENRTRIYLLEHAIEMYPDSAVNYLIRGELYLELREYQLAQNDFEHALELAEAQYDNERWGLGSQAVQDRARRGLQQIVR